MKRVLIIGVLAVSALLLVSGLALAGTPADEQYKNPLPQEPTAPPTEPTTPPTEPPVTETTPPETTGGVSGEETEEEPTLVESVTDSLPFTGFQAGLVLVGGAAVLATGIALRRLGRQRNE